MLRHGVRRLTFSEFLDVVWSEIYDDAPLMGDRQKYREIIVKLYIEAVPPHLITWKDAKGKIHHLAAAPSLDNARGTHAFEQARAMAAKMKAAQQAAREAAAGKGPDVASPPDG